MDKKIDIKLNDLTKDDYKKMDKEQLKRILELKISLNTDNSKSIKEISDILNNND